MALKPETLLVDRLKVTQSQIIQFCQRWHITEFALFGSILRDDFQPDTSDVDVLVVFSPEARKGLSEWLTMQDELAALFGHKVDLVNKVAVQESHNWIRRQNILETAQVIYGGFVSLNLKIGNNTRCISASSCVASVQAVAEKRDEN